MPDKRTAPPTRRSAATKTAPARVRVLRPSVPRRGADDADEMSRVDRQWFTAHPGARSYRRPLAKCEAAALLEVLPALPPGFDLGGDVMVRQLAPGVRSRDYTEIHVVWVGGAA